MTGPTRFPLVVEAVNHLKVRSCLIDGEVVCCDERGVAAFQLLRHRRNEAERLPLRLRLAGAERHGPAQRAERGAVGVEYVTSTFRSAFPHMIFGFLGVFVVF